LPERASVTVGLAELRSGESAEDLLARADDALYEQRQQKGRGR
jgi:PleD family two-component response regulator